MAFYKQFNRRSLKFRICSYFALFAVIIMVILWLLQTIFLDTYYESMKSHELMSAAEKIEKTFAKGDDMSVVITDIAMKSDIYIYLENNTKLWYSAGTNSPRMPGIEIISNLDRIKLQVDQSLTGFITATIRIDGSKSNIKVYASRLESDESDNAFLFMMAPLSPLSSTVDILTSQLIIVTIISILIGLIMSAVISLRLTKPIENISDSAAMLAKGNYDVHFEGGYYSEVVKLADTLNYAADELSKSDLLHKDLIANVSHDLKTPLTMVKSYAEMIRDLSGDNPIKRNQHLEVIIQEADRLNELVNDMTMLSKMQSGVDSICKSVFDLRLTAEEILNRFSRYPEAEGIELRLESPDTAFVSADEKKISQVLYNLIGNALKYGSDGKIVTVRLLETTSADNDVYIVHPSNGVDMSGNKNTIRDSRELLNNLEEADRTEKQIDRTTAADTSANTAGTVIIAGTETTAGKADDNHVIKPLRYSRSVRSSRTVKTVQKYIRCEIIDRGPGIPKEEQDAVWDRYYRASSNLTREKSGTGLGLSIVKEIMKLHNAVYGLQSKEGVGSTFYFVLKKAEASEYEVGRDGTNTKAKSNRQL